MNQEAYDELLVQYSITSQQLGGLSGTAVGETRLLGGKVERLRSELIDAYAAALARIAELEAQLYDEGEGRLVQAYEAIERDTRIAQLEAQLAQREWERVEDTDVVDCACEEDECDNIWHMEEGLLVIEDGDTGYLISVDLGDDYVLCRRVKGAEQ